MNQAEQIFDRIPPASIEAEQAVIASMMLDNRMIPEVLEVVSSDSFFRNSHQQVFQVIADLYERNEAVDTFLLFDELKRRSEIDSELTVDYISDILGNTATAANAVFYAKIVSQKCATRKVIKLAMELARKGFDGGELPIDLLADAEQQVAAIVSSLPSQQKSLTMRDACLQFVATLRQGRKRVFGSGLLELDASIGGVGLGEMLVLGGRPSHAKSAFGLHWLHEASAAGVPCLIISEEMAAIEIGKRSMLRFASIDQDLWNADTADLLERDIKNHFARHAPIYIAEHCHTISKAEFAIRRYAAQGVKIVAIDYLQLIVGAGRQRYEQVGEVSRRIKLAAQKYDVGVLALCQLNRGIEDRNVLTPKLRDLRDSGSIEQDADAVLFLIWPWAAWNEDEIKDGKSSRSAEPKKEDYRIYVGKNCRNRRTNSRKIILSFDCERMQFSSVYQREPAY